MTCVYIGGFRLRVGHSLASVYIVRFSLRKMGRGKDGLRDEIVHVTCHMERGSELQEHGHGHVTLRWGEIFIQGTCT